MSKHNGGVKLSKSLEHAGPGMLLVGRWQVCESQTVPPETRMEFSDRGHLNIAVRKSVIRARYVLAGDTIQLILADGETSETLRVRTLDSDRLALVDRRGKVDVFHRLT